MNIQSIVKEWFQKWEGGDFQSLPLSENFKHTSPFGTIQGKERYLSIVEKNKDKFLGHRFEIHEQLFEEEKACIRYKSIQGEFTLDISEWFYINNGLISEIISHYHIGAIKEERELDM